MFYIHTLRNVFIFTIFWFALLSICLLDEMLFICMMILVPDLDILCASPPSKKEKIKINFIKKGIKINFHVQEVVVVSFF